MYPDRNEIACDCMNVTVGDLEDAVAAGAGTVDAVIEVTGAGKGCGACAGCKELIRIILQKTQGSILP